jgi:SMC interacting uncharacterized protein involved in chromosome segregation
MAIRAITILVILIALSFLYSRYVTGDNKSKSLNELKLSKEMSRDDLLTSMGNDILYQDSILLTIQNELDKIDFLTVKYKSDIENGSQKINQAEAIFLKIRQLKNKIEKNESELKNSNIKNDGLIKLVDRLKLELIKKEEEIQSLKDQVNTQQIIIDQNNQKVQNLNDLNYAQNEQILSLQKDLNSMKAKAYNDLARTFEQIASEVPHVSGWFTKKTKYEIYRMKTGLLNNANKYYEMAKKLDVNQKLSANN